RSLERARAAWSPDLRILPAHYSCERERQPSRVVEGRFGGLAARNPPLAITEAPEFAAWIASRSGAFPEEYRSIKQANLGLGTVSSELADELEAGKNQCAIS
ncbi:MAG: hypothetical protein KBA72_15810, partial [Thermoanaerobaculia bacterium]|nr:hypothetical protein [Thermoanaerobaculia bacterium]